MIDNIVLKDLIAKLSIRDKQIVAMRYLKDKTQSEIAKELGVSQVQVSRLENKILNDIRKKML